MAEFTKNSNHPPSYGSIIADSSMESPENLFKKSTRNYPENSPENSPENRTENSAENLPESLNENSPENSVVNSFEYQTTFPLPIDAASLFAAASFCAIKASSGSISSSS